MLLTNRRGAGCGVRPGGRARNLWHDSLVPLWHGRRRTGAAGPQASASARPFVIARVQVTGLIELLEDYSGSRRLLPPAAELAATAPAADGGDGVGGAAACRAGLTAEALAAAVAVAGPLLPVLVPVSKSAGEAGAGDSEAALDAAGSAAEEAVEAQEKTADEAHDPEAVASAEAALPLSSHLLLLRAAFGYATRHGEWAAVDALLPAAVDRASHLLHSAPPTDAAGTPGIRGRSMFSVGAEAQQPPDGADADEDVLQEATVNNDDAAVLWAEVELIRILALMRHAKDPEEGEQQGDQAAPEVSVAVTQLVTLLERCRAPPFRWGL